MTAEELSREEAWARAWDRRSPVWEALVEVLMTALAPAKDERILDVGAGAGHAAVAAASAVGPSGEVVAVDMVEPVLRMAERRAREGGVENVRFLQIDAGSDEIPGAPFDAVCSLLGVMFFTNPVGAFTNLRNHVRPGGRFVAVAWGDPAENPLLPETLLAPFAPDANWTAVDGVYGPFALAPRGRALAYLGTAEWKAIEVEPIRLNPVVPEEAVFDEALLDMYGVGPRRREEALEHVRAEVARHRSGDGVEMPLSVNVVTAKIPELIQD
jgi:SAM-dependent methyltransferase